MKKIITLFFALTLICWTQYNSDSVDLVFEKAKAPFHSNNVLYTDIFLAISSEDSLLEYASWVPNTPSVSDGTSFALILHVLNNLFYHSEIRIDLRYREFISNPGPPPS